MKLASGIAVLTIALASAYSAPSGAAIVSHGNSSGPTARCQGALPVFETAIRKRPLAVQNEGTSAAFVTCSFEFDSVNALDNTATLVDAYFTNTSATAKTVSCTAVTGFEGDEIPNEYVSLEETIAPGATSEGIYWIDTDFPEGGLASGLVSISCNIPAGVGVNDSYIWWDAEDGAGPT